MLVYLVKTDFQLETSQSTTTLCLMSVSNGYYIQLMLMFPILYHVILTSVLLITLLWHVIKCFLEPK